MPISETSKNIIANACSRVGIPVTDDIISYEYYEANRTLVSQCIKTKKFDLGNWFTKTEAEKLISEMGFDRALIS